MEIKSATLQDLQAELQERGSIIGAFDVLEEDYHRSPGLSSSVLKNFKLSNTAKQALVGMEPKKETASMAFGTAVHMALLEPERFDTSYDILDGDGRTKAYKDKAKYIKESGRKPISSRDYDFIMEVMGALEQSPKWLDWNDGECYAELSYYWVDRGTGIQCRARADLINARLGILDIKTTVDASDRGVYYAMKDYGYPHQMAHYQSGVRHLFPTMPSMFTWLFIDKSARDFRWVNLRAQDEARADTKRQYMLKRYEASTASKVFPGWGDAPFIPDLKEYDFE